MRYTLGLDIGIASVGWCVIDDEREASGIMDLGVRTFPVAEHPKDGSSLALPRRISRGVRRRLRRRGERLKDIRQFLVDNKAAPDLDAVADCLTGPHASNPYELRAAGLDRDLSPDEWCRVLYHIAKRRGFKSNRKSGAEESSEKTKTEGALLGSVEANRKRLGFGQYRTVGEMMCKDPCFAEHKRNKEGDYSSTVGRSELLDEITQLFGAQRRFGNLYASEELERKYTEIFTRQLPVASGDQIEKQTGNCTLLPEYKRAPAMGWTGEYFGLLSRVLAVRWIGQGKDIELNAEQRQKVIHLAFKNNKLTYEQIRKALEIDEALHFKGLHYSKGDVEKVEKSAFFELKGYHSLRKAVEKTLGKEAWQALANSPSQMDSIGKALTFYKSDEEIREFLKSEGLGEEIVEAVLPVSFRGVMRLSAEAMRRLIPYMEKGHGYDAACGLAGFSHYDPKGPAERAEKLPPLTEEEDAIRNPVVVRALSQTRKVVNAVIGRYGPPTWINVELARDLSRSHNDRKKLRDEQEENRRERERSKDEIKETFNFPNPSGGDVLKLRLWREQGERCAYSQETIERSRLFETGYAEIDHALPYSRSMDNSYSNKVLALSSENQNKKDRTPYEYLSALPGRWEAFQGWVRANIRNAAKRNKLLRENLSDSDSEEMKERSLTDTRYITRFAANWLRRRLRFADETIKNPVLCVNGRVTAQLRGRWGLEKKREEGDSHHALDAAVIAAATAGMVKKISDYSRRGELNRHHRMENGEKERFPLPWPGFRDELLARLSPHPPVLLNKEETPSPQPLFVSRAPRRKAKGEAHDATIRSRKNRGGEGGEKWDKKGTVSRASIKKLTLKNLEDMVGKERDARLYEALKERLEAFGGNGAKAFAEPFYKPTRDGKQGPLVRSVKLYRPGASGIPVRGGLADNGEMVRVDVYFKGGKFFLVPHYVDDIAKKRVKKRAIAPGKPEEQWTPVDDSFEFRFSLFKDELIRVVARGEEYFGYYAGTHRLTGTINMLTHDNSKGWEGVGVKTCQIFEKYYVDVLGGYYKIEKEKPPAGKEG